MATRTKSISTINTTPLVDVMLVLLIIFLITVPVVRMSIPVELPKERNEVRETKPENIVISVDAQARIYWNDLRMPNTNALVERLKKVAVLTPQPEVQIRGDGRGELRRRRARRRTPASARASRRSASSPSRRRARRRADAPEHLEEHRNGNERRHSGGARAIRT